MRLIDATRLVKLALLERDKIPLTIVERYSFGTQSPNRHGQSMRGGIRKILRLIEQAPTIDAVPVVRCKDCKYAYSGNGIWYWCGTDERKRPSSFYCSTGRRRDEDEGD